VQNSEYQILLMTDYAELRRLADDESLLLTDRRIAEALASAMNDWPTFNLTSLEEYIVELRREVAGPLTLANIRSKGNSYYVSDAWKGESLACLLSAWGPGDRDVTLDDLIKRIVPGT
jgi:hypothetical protein